MTSPGTAANAVSAKKDAQSSCSDSHPAGAESNRVGNAASDENSAYCVAVNATLQRLDREATNPADAIPPGEVSEKIGAVSSKGSCPTHALTTYMKIDAVRS